MKKTILASLALASALVATGAQANDTAIGAVVGGGMGGLIGHSVNGQQGAVVGALVGAAAGAILASNSGPRYAEAHYGAPAYRVHPAPVYYAPPPAYYGRPAVVTPVYYRGRPDWHRGHHDRHHAHRHPHRHWH